jgi:ERCC4-type nuclease
VPISDFRQIVNGIPGVGFKASLAAERKFKTVRRAMRASIQEWAELTTLDDKGKPRRLGEKLAVRIDKVLG